MPHETAQEVIARVRARRVRMCANCEHIDAETGYCHKLRDTPPVEYLTEPTDCPHWLDWIPF